MKTVEEKIADVFAAVVVFGTLMYFVGHAVAAWLNGAFQAVMR